MQRSLLRILLPVALASAFVGCSDEPEADAGESPSADLSTPATATASSAPIQSPTLPAFERAMRALTNGSNVRFEIETAQTDGSFQYGIGSGNKSNASFVLRTLPNASPEFDGNWLRQGGRYLKESGAGFDPTMLSPLAVERMFNAISAIPQSEASLVAEAARTELVGSVECSVRKIDLAKHVRLLSDYRAMEVCVDEARGNLVRLNVEMQSGERLTATFAGHGENVQTPPLQITDWSREFPLR